MPDYIYRNYLIRTSNENTYHWRGYARLPAGHPLFVKTFSDYIPVTEAMLEREVDNTMISTISLLCQSGEELAAKRLRLDLAFFVHGGITFSAPFEEDSWWLGFDAAHAGDDFGLTGSGIYRDEPYMHQQAENLVDQLIEYAETFS
jgi:hypothetical protein